MDDKRLLEDSQAYQCNRTDRGVKQNKYLQRRFILGGGWICSIWVILVVISLIWTLRKNEMLYPYVRKELQLVYSLSVLKWIDLYKCFINSVVLCVEGFGGALFGFYMACYGTVRDPRCEFSQGPPGWAVVEAEGPGLAQPRAEVWQDQTAAPCLGGAFQGDWPRLFTRVHGWSMRGARLELKQEVHVSVRKNHCEERQEGPSTEAVQPWGSSGSYWEMS